MTRLGVWLAGAVLATAGLAVPGPGSAADVVIEHGVALPPGPDGSVANGVAYVGNAVYASFRPADSPGANGVVYRTPSDGSGSWDPVMSPGTSTPLSAPADGLVARGDAMLVTVNGYTSTACGDYLLIIPSGTRALQSCGAAPVLGHGGLLVARRTSQPMWRIDGVVSGTYVGSIGTSRSPVLDGGRLWYMTPTQLIGLNELGGGSTALPVPPECLPSGVVDVVGRFAILDCRGGPVLVDVSGELTPRRLPPGDWRLGEGFAYDEHTSDPGAPTHRTVAVTDFTQVPSTHVYGWSSHSGPDNAVGRGEPDDARGPSLAMLTESGQVERVDLDWLGSPPTDADDTVPPVVDNVTGSPAVVTPASLDAYRTTPITFTWAGHDPEGSSSLTYDVRLSATVGSVDPSWEYPSQWTGTFADSVVHDARVDENVCFEVRARDWVGNSSAGPDGGWSAPRCTLVASQPPLVWGSIDLEGAAGVGVRLGPTPVTFRFEGDDDVGPVASYGVDYRYAAPGALLGDWVSPALWQHITATSVSQSVQAGAEICFRARGWDRAGSVSAYSYPRCLSVPYDDRAFQVRDGAKRIRLDGALGNTATKLRRLRGSMVLPGVHARQVWVRVVGGTADMCVTMTLGRRHGNGCFIQQMAGARWEEYRFKPGSHGRLRIRAWRKLVDAVVVIR